MALASCTTTNPIAKAIWCDTNKEPSINASAYARMDQRSVDWYNDHTSKGEEWCGWKGSGG